MIHILELNREDDEIINLTNTERDIESAINYIMKETPKEQGRSENDIRSLLEVESLFYYYIGFKCFCAIDISRKKDRMVFYRYEKFISVNRENKLKILGI